jgi:hypothetical protein
VLFWDVVEKASVLFWDVVKKAHVLFWDVVEKAPVLFWDVPPQLQPGREFDVAGTAGVT